MLEFRDPIMGSLKITCRTSYRSSMHTIALNYLVFLRKSRSYVRIFGNSGRTDKQMNSPNALSRDLAIASGGLIMARLTIRSVIAVY